MTETQAPLVLHVIHHLVMGGMENGLVNLINRMPQSKFRHAVVCVEDFSDFRDRITRPDVEVVAIHRSRVGIWGLRAEIFRLCRRLKPAILHSRNMSGLDAILPARLAGVRHCIHGEHGWDVNDLTGDEWKPALLRRIHAPLVERYITVSNDLKTYLVDRVGIECSRITQIYNGVDTERFFPRVDRSVSELPPNLLDDDSVVIGTVGRIQPVKDQETLVRAFASMVRADRNLAARARLAIVGNGPLLPRLRNLVDSLGIASSVWLPGAVSNVPDVLRSLDVFVLPSLSEGISNTILEAMATGLPILATHAGGNMELIEEGWTGESFAPGDVPALAEILAKYVADPVMRLDMSVRCRRVAVEKFGLARMVAQYQAVYEDLALGALQCGITRNSS